MPWDGNKETHGKRAGHNEVKDVFTYGQLGFEKGKLASFVDFEAGSV